MDHMWLQLTRSAAQQAALEQYLQETRDPSSPNFHKWLTAAEFGANFGVPQSDIQTITNWLESHGFTVNGVEPSRMLIDFSGTAGQVRQAFHTEIHNLNVNGQSRIGNVSDQQIPASLAAAVAGVVSLSTIHPHPMHTSMQAAVPMSPSFSSGSARYVGAGDFATIYNLNPLFSAGVTGQGQTVAVLENSDVSDPGEWSQFRRLFGLTRPYVYGSFTQIHPTSTATPCTDPGVNGDADESTLDAQWASAAAPNATIILASCSDSDNLGFGVFTALVNLLNNSSTPPAIMSISFGGSEAEQGADGNAFINEIYMQAVSEGVSLFVSAGDAGADSNTTDRTNNLATTGISVNGLASTQYNVAVGGTDYEDTYLGTTNTYWNTSNSVTEESAKSYIPEIPWNNSCASALIATHYGFTGTGNGLAFCNSTVANADGYLNIIAGSGGPSSCATMPNGTCQGYPKPSWQAGTFGNPADGVRDLPDVALFAAISVHGTWNHAYIFCYSAQGFSCGQGYFYSAGGTSFSSPIMAGIQALINQKTGLTRQGNVAPIYYALGNTEYGATGNSACNSSAAGGPAASCIFHDITAGDMDIVCKPGTPNCYSGAAGNTNTYGVLSVSSTSLMPAYPAGSGWDFATGLGSVNAYNLVMGWPTTPPATVAGSSLR